MARKKRAGGFIVDPTAKEHWVATGFLCVVNNSPIC